ncbi:hypothetical protein [Streptomyces sp. NPDC085540]|uniref:hypothetical protein n=1 Tax=Streptomyces sp. NPDC085540 TaxID=3365730 RepID=UPI0037D15D96
MSTVLGYVVLSARGGAPRELRYALGQLDGLHHRAFEWDRLRRDGYGDARQVGGRGDNGAGRQIRDGDVLVMLTIGRITDNAAQFANGGLAVVAGEELLKCRGKST